MASKKNKQTNKQKNKQTKRVKQQTLDMDTRGTQRQQQQYHSAGLPGRHTRAPIISHALCIQQQVSDIIPSFQYIYMTNFR